MLGRIADQLIKSAGLKRALKGLRDEFAVARMHRRGVALAKSYRERTGLKLNIGSGPNAKPGWVNIDLRTSSTTDLSLDMREPVPLADGSCDIVYSEHFFEHLDYPGDANRFLGECFRLLRAEGVFSAGVPDTEWPLQAYVKGEHDYFDFVNEYHHPKWCRTRMDNINYHFRQEGKHRYAYDCETFELILRDAGFTRVQRRAFDPKLDTLRRKMGTLYIEGIKP